MKTILPMPGVLTGDVWDVRPSATRQGMTDPGARVMHVPAGADPADRGVRQHELLHAAWSPHVPDGSDLALLAAEDGRIESLATARGIIRDAPLSADEIDRIIASMCDTRAYTSIAMFMAAGIGSPGEEYSADAIHRYVPGEIAARLASLAERIRARYATDLSFAAALEVADWLRAWEPFDSDDDGSDGDGSDGDGSDGDGSDDDGSDDDGSDDDASWYDSDDDDNDLPPAAWDDTSPTPMGLHRQVHQRIADTDSPADVTCPSGTAALDEKLRWIYRWAEDHVNECADGPCEMIVEKVPLPILITRSGRVRARSWSETGSVPWPNTHMHYSGKAFRRRNHGGTVVIDCSGSMNLSVKSIRDLITAIPAATVAGYASGLHIGWLRIFAARGRMTDQEHLAFESGGNGVDLPVIRWLARQPGPRIWICDGMVTGLYDGVLNTRDISDLWRMARAARVTLVTPTGDYVQRTIRALSGHSERR